MKIPITIPVLIMFMVYLTFSSHAMAMNDTPYTITMQKSSKEQPSHNKHLDDEGRRSSPAPIFCIISHTSGIEMMGLSEDIIGYEVWDADSEIKLAFFSEETEFLDFLFLQVGNLQIKLETENYFISGYIKMN